MPKQYIVVDQHDKIITYKARKSDIDPNKEYYRVSALRLTNSHGEILIAQRSFNKSHNPGKRGPAVAGTVEKGETYKQNIIKEAHEELGLQDLTLITGPKLQHQTDYKHFIQRFLATIDKELVDFTIEKEAIAAIKRISKEELTKDIELYPESYLTNMKTHVKNFN